MIPFLVGDVAASFCKMAEERMRAEKDAAACKEAAYEALEEFSLGEWPAGEAEKWRSKIEKLKRQRSRDINASLLTGRGRKGE